MEERLTVAAKEGNIDRLYELIGVDGELLTRINNTPFKETPLHTAAAAGQTHFAIEILTLMPSMGKKIDRKGLSPLHLALQHGHVETAQRLVKLDGELVRVKGKRRYTPLHYVAGTDYIDLLAEFLMACPASVEDLTIQDQTAVHIAVEKKKIGACKVLVGWLQRTSNAHVLDWKDDKGNTVLHAAAYTNQPKVVKLVVNKVERNATNLEGQTAGAIAVAVAARYEAEGMVYSKDIKKILCNKHIETVTGRHLQAIDISTAKFLGSKERIYEKVIGYIFPMPTDLSIDMRNAVLVVAALIVTTTYQAILQPPGGVRQANGEEDTTTNKKLYSPQPNRTSARLAPGKVVMSEKLFDGFVPANTIAFMASIGVIMYILQLQPYTLWLRFCLICLMGSYIIAVDVISQSRLLTYSIASYGLISFLASLNITIVGMALSFLKYFRWLPQKFFIVKDAIACLLHRYLPWTVKFARRLMMQRKVAALARNNNGRAVWAWRGVYPLMSVFILIYLFVSIVF